MSISELREGDRDGEGGHSTRLVELDWSNTDEGEYQTAGNIAFYPTNTRDKVNRLKTALRITQNSVYTIDNHSDQKLPVPAPLSTNSLLLNYYDLNGEITKADLIKI